MNQVPVTQAYGDRRRGRIRLVRRRRQPRAPRDADDRRRHRHLGARRELARRGRRTTGSASTSRCPTSEPTPIAGDALFMYSPGHLRRSQRVHAGGRRDPGDPGRLRQHRQLRQPRATATSEYASLAGNAADLRATVRSARVTPGGAAYGYALGAIPLTESLGPGSSSHPLHGGAGDRGLDPRDVHARGRGRRAHARGAGRHGARRPALQHRRKHARGVQPGGLGLRRCGGARRHRPRLGHLRVAPAVRQHPRPRHVRRRDVGARLAARRLDHPERRHPHRSQRARAS